jgi:hypothetical protein
MRGNVRRKTARFRQGEESSNRHAERAHSVGYGKPPSHHGSSRALQAIRMAGREAAKILRH